MQTLLSLPPALVDCFPTLENRQPPEWFGAADPEGSYLGSGGGTTHLLVEAWKHTGQGKSFRDWLATDNKLVIHAGGQSRRLPAYGPSSKALVPIPVFRWAKGQRVDQTLLDLQVPFYRRLLDRAPARSVAMITCGDVLLRSKGTLPPLPDVDVLCIGLWVAPEAATRHGVFFVPRSDPERLRFFLQKPSTDQIRDRATDHLFLVDTGIWLLSERALAELMRRSGWDERTERFAQDQASRYELYAEFGLRLGTEPTVSDPQISTLSAAVVPLPAGEFYHFGASRELIHSCLRLQNLVLDQREVGVTALKPHPEMFVQNAPIGLTLQPENDTLWVENSCLPATWRLTREHVITGVPRNNWTLDLPPGTCLDIVPVGDSQYCIRVYGIDDDFRGAISQQSTHWCGAPARNWFHHRELWLDQARISPDTDIQDAPIFPVLNADQLDGPFIQWLLSGSTDHNPQFADRWLRVPRMSGSDLACQANLSRLFCQQADFRRDGLLAMARNADRSVFYNLDLAHTAKLLATLSPLAPEHLSSSSPLSPEPLSPAPDDHSAPSSAVRGRGQGEGVPPRAPSRSSLMRTVHQRMFQATLRRLRGDNDWTADEQSAFHLLREAMISETRQRKVQPQRNILDDQIIWGRSPVRLDLAGGWTDTPPYCLIHGGKVVNVAVNLNGQPPIQVFARLADQPHIVLRSIDLGVEERITRYDDLRTIGEVGSGFSIARAALALAGFSPDFAARPAFDTLQQQLQSFGGGIEISLLAAVPKGSGLGTSSILAATLLGTLGELCALNWDHAEICRRTLTLEQMLTTGGGWQDQIGGIARGLKLIETHAGLTQDLVVRWLPDHLFEDSEPKRSMLLYYTGITRVAKNILAEIVRGMFLNSGQHLETLAELGQHALDTYEVLLRHDWQGLCDCIRRSWQLNQQLDAGTNPPEVQSILNRVQGELAAIKLLGAGGGGYMLMLARTPESALRIRSQLTTHPPNPKARFVNFTVSQTGLEITRS